jgi:serine/threonine-protein kinase
MTTSVDPTRLVGGRYVLEKLIGEGGTGEVWRARHVTLRSPVAIKLLHGSAAFKESTRKRFLTEARVAAQLNTRHAVKVFDFGVTDQGRPYLIMELLDGETLAQRLERVRVLTPFATAKILRLAARALDAAHGLGVVHRDFKPENIFLVRSEEDEEEDVKVVDFGVAKLVGTLDSADEESIPISSRQLEKAFVSFTRTGKAVGTPCYMAPEQVKSPNDVGPAADVWAMGVVAYECLTGFRPFVAKDIPTLFEHIATCAHTPAAERNLALPEDFEDWFRKACSPDPRKRFSNASAASLALIDVLAIQRSMFSGGESESSQMLMADGPRSAVSSRPVPRAPSLTPGASSAMPDVSAAGGHRRSPWRVVIGAAVVLAVAGAFAMWWHGRPVTDSEPNLAGSMLAPGSFSSEPGLLVGSVATGVSEGSGAPVVASTDQPPAASASAAMGVPSPAAPVRVKEAKVAVRDSDEAEPGPSAPPPPPPDPPKPAPPATTPASPFELPDLGL